jgi:hypothetical protein
MIKLISKPWAFLKSLIGLLFPMVCNTFPSLAGDPGRPARWTARTFMLAIVLVILAMINHASWFGITNRIIGNIGAVRDYWLPLFFLCLYAMIWLAWWLYRVLIGDIDPVTSEFPDIDDAWAEALKKMKSEEINPDEVPLFLVLGWPSSSEEAFFRSTGIRAQVKQYPHDPSNPLHVTANRHGIWVTCPGASVLGQVNQMEPEESDRTASTIPGDTANPYNTMGGLEPSDLQGTMNIQQILANFKHMPSQGRAASALGLRPRVDRELHEARLKHLCRLIARDRHGFCPVNGVLLLLPIGAAEPRSNPEEIVRACKTDLAAAFGVFRMRCPVLMLICGLEEVPGFHELVKNLPPEVRKKRIGQRFPLVPQLAPGDVPDQVESSVEFTATSLFPSMVQTQFQVEGTSGENTEAVFQVNSQLFRFMTGILERRERLARLVKDCLPVLPGQPLMFGGCYFAATGNDSDTQQAFAPGVLSRMIDKQEQDSVTWTTQTLADDASAWRRARFLRMFFVFVITLIVLYAVYLIVPIFLGKGSPTEAPGKAKTSSKIEKTSDNEP